MDHQQVQQTTVNAPETSPQLDQVKYDMLMRRLQSQQNMMGAVLFGSIAALGTAIIWAVITAITNYQIGYMAVGVGFAVGYAVRKFGQGVDQSFGVLGAVLSLFGCLLGNLFAMCSMAASELGVSVFDILSVLNGEMIVEGFKEWFSLVDLLFYGVALYYGYTLSFRQLTEQEQASLIRPA